MARSRNIKPGFFTNADLAECQPLARILFAGLWTIADKAGRLRDRPKQLKGELLPYDDCEVDALLNELASGDEPFIHRYEAQGVAYIQIATWDKHQSPHHTERDSVIPPFVNGDNTVRARRAPIYESGINEEGIRDQESAPPTQAAKRFTPPTVDEVREYCVERKNKIDPDQFHDHYESNGWLIGGKSRMKDWKAAVRNWERNNFAPASPKKPNDPRGTLSAAQAYLAMEGPDGQ
jgi:hypothetical protein